jgi:hypothetical protein
MAHLPPTGVDAATSLGASAAAALPADAASLPATPFLATAHVVVPLGAAERELGLHLVPI